MAKVSIEFPRCREMIGPAIGAMYEAGDERNLSRVQQMMVAATMLVSSPYVDVRKDFLLWLAEHVEFKVDELLAEMEKQARANDKESRDENRQRKTD